MADGQLDLFAAAGAPAEERSGAPATPCAPAVGLLDDGALVAALPGAGLAEAPALAAEAGRRRLAAAIPALERLCLRFAGFGLEQAIPEQIAALDALARTGCKAAAQAVARLIVRGAVQGPNRKAAVGVAAALRANLPTAVLCALLQDAEPELRAHACRCAGAATPAVLALLLGLADDGAGEVRAAAVCALGHMGRREARGPLARLLRHAPSAEVIDAVAAVADEECVVLLARIARTRPALAGAAREALELIDHPRARQIVAAMTAGRGTS